MKKPKNYWKDKDNMMEEAKKYSTKEEFQKNNLSAFLAAHKYGYIEKMDWMVKQKQHKKKPYHSMVRLFWDPGRSLARQSEDKENNNPGSLVLSGVLVMISRLRRTGRAVFR